ncbi:MAG: 5-(carboxyamino)imidazole ribonucleotide synthase [Candidatus Kapaibacterium sp.]
MIKSLYTGDKPFTLGILGGGQLAKMLALDAYRMGLNVSVIDKSPGTPAGDMTKSEFPGGWENDEELNKFIDSCDLVTLENEFIDPEILEKVSIKRKVYPTPQTMRIMQDKFIQKTAFKKAFIPVPDFEEINSPEEAAEFGNKHGWPYVIKARKYGYDGYGNETVLNEDEARTAFEKFNGKGKDRPLMGEKFIDFSMELAVMVARNVSGEHVIYPCVRTIQKDHILHELIAPAPVEPAAAVKAQELALKCVESINGVGVFGIEMFLTGIGEVLVNEIAPRPHNSGHYTIEACYTSQYENCIRAILDMPLGSTEMIKPGAAMINLLGERHGSGVPSDVSKMLESRASLHLYNKKESRPGRKMGHITALGDSPEEAFNTAREAADLFKW